MKSQPDEPPGGVVFRQAWVIVTPQMLRRAVVIAICSLAVPSWACSGVNLSGGPTPSPANAASVNAAIEHSTMRSAHFRLMGTVATNGYRIPVTGDGVLQLKPAVALQWKLTAPIPNRGDLVIQTVVVGGRIYGKVGAGSWSSQPESVSPTAATTYLGEDTVAGEVTWHTRSQTSTSLLDTWVRESDGYVVQLAFSNSSGSFTMFFDSYNASPVITAP